MVRNFIFILVFVLTAGSALAQQAGPVLAQSDSTYQLGSGDILSIRVFGVDELSFEKVPLNDAGIFSFPFLGDVRAKGKTAADIERLIVKGLKGDYLLDPKVSVRILQYRNFYINGEVAEPGGYPFSPGLTVRTAVALAGGFTRWAARSDIDLIREGKPESEAIEAAMDTAVAPGDIITVNQSLF